MTDEVLNKVDDINSEWSKLGLGQSLEFTGTLQRQMTPSEQYKFINDIAQHTFNSGGRTASNPIVRKIGKEMSEQFYDDVGDIVPLREVNQKLHRIQKYTGEVGKSLRGESPRNLTSGKTTFKKMEGGDALDALGKEIDLDVGKYVDDLSRKSSVNEFYRNANTYFSDRDAMREVVSGASKGSGLGLTTGFALGNPTAGAVIGTIAGAASGKVRASLLRSPEKAFTRMSEYAQKGADWGKAADKTLDNTTFQYLNFLLNSGAAGLSSGR